jgi:hypothetical protein
VHPVTEGPEPDGRPVVADLPCQTCGKAEGTYMLVCEWCSRASTHLGCAGLPVVPKEVWVCTGCGRHRAEAQEAADLDGRFVLGSFPGYHEPFYFVGWLMNIEFTLNKQANSGTTTQDNT